MEQENPGSAVKAKQGRDAPVGNRHGLWWAEASIWTDRMVSALGNGVKGGKWFSLIDKVVRPTTLEIAWQRVARNKGGRIGGHRWDVAKQTICSGPMPSSRIMGCSPCLQPMTTRDAPDEETSDWRAVCGRTARTVRRAGGKGLGKGLPTPIGARGRCGDPGSLWAARADFVVTRLDEGAVDERWAALPADGMMGRDHGTDTGANQ